MHITKVSTLVVNARMRNWIFVKVETSEPGLWGWGEATLEWKTKGVTGAVEDLSVLLIGQDPLRIEHLWQIMHRQYFWRDGITGMSAISGIDQALWDIKGKEAGKPVCELLGGPVRDTLRYLRPFGRWNTGRYVPDVRSRALRRGRPRQHGARIHRCQGYAHSGFRVDRKPRHTQTRGPLRGGHAPGCRR